MAVMPFSAFFLTSLSFYRGASVSDSACSFISCRHTLPPSTYICTYIRTYVRTNKRTYVPTYVRTYVRTYVCTYVRTYVRMYVRMYVLYVCTYVCTYIRMYVQPSAKKRRISFCTCHAIADLSLGSRIRPAAQKPEHFMMHSVARPLPQAPTNDFDF